MILTIISLFLAKNCVLNGPEMLNFSAIFLVASLTWKRNRSVEIVFKNLPIHKLCANPRPPLYFKWYNSCYKPEPPTEARESKYKLLLCGHCRERDNWPINRGGRLMEAHPKKYHWPRSSFSLSNVSTNQCKWRKSRTMMVIMRSIALTKLAKETITFPHQLPFFLTFFCVKTSNFKSSSSFKRNKTKHNHLWESWPRPLNRGGRWEEVLLVYSW